MLFGGLRIHLAHVNVGRTKDYTGYDGNQSDFTSLPNTRRCWFESN